MSDLFKGGTSTSNTTTSGSTNSSTDPSAFQMPALMAGLNGAQGALANAPGYTPQAYSQLSPATLAALSSMSGYATGTGMAGAGALTGAGTAALGGLTTAQAGANGVLGQSMSDPTAANIRAASAYASNPYTQQMISAANTPIQQQLDEVSVPGLNINAAGTGNTDSSRAGTAEAILRRDAGTQMSNNAGTILGNQYNNGLTLAENSRATNMNAGLGAVGALTGIGTAGAGLVGQGNTQALTDLGVPVSTGQAVTADQNTANQVDYANSQAASQYPWQQLSNYWNIAGKPLGSTTTGTTSGTNNGTQQAGGPGVIGGLMGLATGVGSFFAPTGLTGTGPSLASNILGMFGSGNGKGTGGLT